MNFLARLFGPGIVPPQRSKAYRPEIDGLRAVAVIAVLINHLDPHWLPGGFLGVDIFFVISGYVVTSSLLARRMRIAGNSCGASMAAASAVWFLPWW